MSEKIVPAPPIFQRPAPSHKGLLWGAVALVVVAVAAVALVCVFESRPSDLAKLEKRYDDLAAAGNAEEAASALLDVRAAAKDLYAKRRFDEAKKGFEWLVSKDPKCAEAMNFLGTFERERADSEARKANEAQGVAPPAPPKVLPNYDKAIEWFKRAAQADPLTSAYNYNLALIYFGQKNYAECDKQLDQARKTGLKAQYYLLWSLSAEGAKQPPAVLKERLRLTVSCAAAQSASVAPADLAPDGSIARAWKEAARRLSELGDDTGWETMRKLSTDAKRPEVREFAKSLLKSAAAKKP